MSFITDTEDGIIEQVNKGFDNIVETHNPTIITKSQEKPKRRWDVQCHLVRQIGARKIAEIGVQKGQDIGHVLRSFRLDSFLMVDIKYNPNFDDYIKSNGFVPPADYQIKSSVEASREIADESLDLCYIDAGHSYESVLSDCRAWAPKVRPGGILAGHDYNSAKHMGVSRAVNELYNSRIEAYEVKNCYIWVVRIPD